ncbi:hypothetical protein CBR_g36587 [Chara braunii]|uniref:ATG1a/b/c MIT domain-containing protein n=1 Tax=Chara braunii TaxID=69332 RepID=A0A388JZ72_CHABU|nr:hypothetical protein CBR_g36587 [Chara braunii]|eukprot:GBG63100.1 hypothetical protein CBR_g36587 [Chara braunii]
MPPPGAEGDVLELGFCASASPHAAHGEPSKCQPARPPQLVHGRHVNSAASAIDFGEDNRMTDGVTGAHVTVSPSQSPSRDLAGEEVGLGSGRQVTAGSPQGDALVDCSETPSDHPPTRLASLQRCARLVSELAVDKWDAGQQLDALALQLLCLAIWREALSVCHKWAASTSDGENFPFLCDGCYFSGGSAAMSTSPASHNSRSVHQGGGGQMCSGDDESVGSAVVAAACSAVEKDFLAAVEKAEEFAQHLEVDGKFLMAKFQIVHN